MTEVLQQEIRTLKDIFESERDPEGRVFVPLADAFRRAGEMQQAVRLLNDGIARHPEFVPGHVVAARLYVEQGLAEEAAIAARNALELDRENVNALRSLLQVLEEKGDGEAEEVRGRLVSLDTGFSVDGTEITRTASPSPVEAEAAAASPETEPDVAAVDEDAETVELRALGADGRPPVLEETGALAAVPIDLDLVASDDVDSLDLSPLADDSDASMGGSALDVAADPDMQLAGEEPVIDLDELAPEPEEDVVALTDLVPEAEESAPVIDLADLSPIEDDDLAVALVDLAPDEAEEVTELTDLAPEPLVDLADLAPAEPDDVIIDMDALGPSTEDAQGAVPTDDGPDAPAGEVEEDMGASADEPDKSPGEPVYTRTLGELYVKQGAIDQAIEVFRHLSDLDPTDADVARRLEEIESSAPFDGEDVGGAIEEEEVEALARELAEGGDGEHDVESPFAWSDEGDVDAGEAQSGPTIGDYFEGLFSWKPGGKS